MNAPPLTLETLRDCFDGGVPSLLDDICAPPLPELAANYAKVSFASPIIQPRNFPHSRKWL